MIDNKAGIERAAFMQSIMAGSCPKCGGANTHDCEALEGSIIGAGSDCPVAKILDAVDVGHCDECGALWCLGCGKVLKEAPSDRIGLIVSVHLDICPSLRRV